MKKQNYNSSVDDIIHSLQGEERNITQALRALILNTISIRKEKISYGAPFYYGHKSLCFIWPSSIPWGNLKSGVAFGFTYAYLMPSKKIFQFDERIRIGRLVYQNVSEINSDLVTDLLLEAAEIDQQNYINKNK